MLHEHRSFFKRLHVGAHNNKSRSWPSKWTHWHNGTVCSGKFNARSGENKPQAKQFFSGSKQITKSHLILASAIRNSTKGFRQALIDLCLCRLSGFMHWLEKLLVWSSLFDRPRALCLFYTTRVWNPVSTSLSEVGPGIEARRVLNRFMRRVPKFTHRVARTKSREQNNGGYWFSISWFCYPILRVCWGWAGLKYLQNSTQPS